MAKHSTTHSANEPKSGFMKLGKHWPWLIVGMLIFHASIIVGTILIVNSRHDLYVESDYYAKSVDWDNQRSISENAEKMGWDISLNTQQAITPEGAEDTTARIMQVEFFDRNNDPIDGALVEIECFHPAHANNRTNLVLVGQGDGKYAREFTMHTPGLWHVNFSIRYQGVYATLSREIEIYE
tara:strand:+ start:74 stop:619 length:546 start_codon:yes stop_codon:yes gene_type:complete